MIQFSIKNHWPAFLLAVCVGLIILLPTVLSIKRLGPGNFKGIYPMFSDDEDHYLAEVKEVYDGHWGLGNPYLKENKIMPYTQPPLGPMYYAGFAKLFGISVPVAAGINDFLLPFVAVLLLYNFFFLLTQSKKISLSFSALFFIFFLSAFNRPVNPQLSLIFLLAGLYLVWLIVDRKYDTEKILTLNLLLSLAFGILVYISPFYWMTLVVLYVLLTFFRAWLEKNFKYCLKNWLCFFTPSFIWSIPFFLNVKKIIESSSFVETSLRSGFISTHVIGSFINVAIIFACLPIVYLVQKISLARPASAEATVWQSKKIVFLGYSLIISGIILNWQNVLTGKIIQFSPHFYPIIILFVFIISTVSWTYIDWKKFSKNSFTMLCFLLILLTAIFYKQKNEILYAFKIIHSPKNVSSVQTLSPIMDWLNNNTALDSTIYALGRDYSWAIPIYTYDNLYFNSNAGLSLMSDIEIENRWTIQHFFEPVNEKYIKDNAREIWTNKFIEVYQSLESRRTILQFITRKMYSETTLADDFYINRVLDADIKFKNIGFEKAIKTYAVDYVILDKSYNQYVDLAVKFKSYKSLTLLVKIGDTLIYKVN